MCFDKKRGGEKAEKQKNCKPRCTRIWSIQTDKFYVRAIEPIIPKDSTGFLRITERLYLQSVTEAKFHTNFKYRGCKSPLVTVVLREREY